MRTKDGPVAEPDDTLTHWLTRLGQEGQLESEGSFSVSLVQAWEKLGAFQLPFPEAWVLKLVQAAVAGGATSIRVFQNRSRTLLRFLGVDSWCWDELRRRFLSLNTDPDAALSHLAIAVRALATTTQHAFLLVFPKDVTVLWKDQQFQTRESDPSESSFSIAISHQRSLDVASDKSFMAGIGSALCDHCHLCPVPLSIDTRRINSVLSDPWCQPLQNSLPLAYLKADTGPTLPTLTLPGSAWRSHVPDGPQPAFDLQHPFDCSDDPCGAAILLCGFQKNVHFQEVSFASYRQRSYLAWVRDGVVVAREALGIFEPVACLVLVSAQGLETDLTGFELRQTEALNERRTAALAALCKKLATLWDTGTIVREGSPSVLSVLGWGGVLLTVLIPPAGLPLLWSRWSDVNRAKKKQAEEFNGAWKSLYSRLRKKVVQAQNLNPG